MHTVVADRVGRPWQTARRRVTAAAAAATSDAARLRAVLRVGATVLIAWSLVDAVRMYPDAVAAGLSIAAPVVAVAIMLLRRWRPLLLALSAGVVCYCTPDAVSLAVAAGCLVYLAVSYDDDPVPWTPLAAASIGSVTSLVGLNYNASVAPFVATALGLGAGLLERRLAALEGETTVLRRRTEASEEQAQWLEQRTALARELHDVVGHHVTAMVVQAEAGLVEDPRYALRTIGGLGRTALSELDALVVHLRDPHAEITVPAPPRLADVDELLAAPLRHQGVAVEVRMQDPALADGLGDAGVLALYRIAQEALTNVARHAAASVVWVDLSRVGDHVLLRVADDGLGPPERPARGTGLLGIAERVHAHGGMWSMSRRPGGGTILDAYLPLPR